MEDCAPLLLAEAAEAVRGGALPRAEELGLRAATLVGLGPRCFHTPDAAAGAAGAVAGAAGAVADAPGAAALGEASAAIGACGAVSGSLPGNGTAPVLAMLLSVWVRMGERRKAAAACALLLRVRAHGGAAASLDTALMYSQLSRLHRAIGDATAAAAATASADAAATAAAAAATTAGTTLPGFKPAGDTADGAGCLQLLLGSAMGGGAPAGGGVPLPLPPPPPEALSACAKLETVELRQQRLAVLPAAVCQLPALRVLDASENRIASLPDALCDVCTLRELLLANNEIDCAGVPKRLSALPQLYVLNLQGNRLAELPAAVRGCPRLRHLRWGAQKPARGGGAVEASGGGGGGSGEPAVALGCEDGEGCGACGTEIEEGFASQTLVVLEFEANGQRSIAPLHPCNPVLNAVLGSFNRLGVAPPQLAHYGASLKKLHLGCNGIRSESLAAVLPSLLRLQELCLEGNLLEWLPACVGRLQRLRELWLHGNQLAALPEELGRCASLTVLQCHHNQLTALPAALGALTRLQGLYLQSNQLRGLAALRERVFRHMPLQNLALGANDFDLAEAFEARSVRIGLAWNCGTPPPALAGKLTDRFSIVDHAFDAASHGTRSEVLLVAFAAQGPGMQQWGAAAVGPLRAAGVPLDALYLVDPSNSYYLQDPTRSWRGVAHYADLVRRHAEHYKFVLMVGSSMGATAALTHAHLAHSTLAFGPRVDLQLTHGSYVPAAAKATCTAELLRSLRTVHAHGHRAAVHVGSGNAVDVMQAGLVRGMASIAVVEHDTFHHNVPMFLEREGRLVPLLKATLLRLLRLTVDSY